MQRTINHTNRRKLGRKEVSIQLEELPQGPPQVTAEFSFENNLAEDAAVYLEAYCGNTMQRFDCGTVKEPNPPAGAILDSIDLTGKTLFRVRVVDESGHVGRLLASANAIKAESEEDPQEKASLITLISRPLGQQTWRVNIPDGAKPELIVNNAIPDAIGKMKSDPVFQSLVLPAAFREVLMFYVWDNNVDEGTPQELWLRFAESFAGEHPDTEDATQMMEWVDLAVERFSEHFKLLEMLALKLEGHDQ